MSEPFDRKEAVKEAVSDALFQRRQEESESDAYNYAVATAANNGFSPAIEDAPEGYYEALERARSQQVKINPDTKQDPEIPF